MTSSRYFTPPIPNGWFQVAYEDELTPGSVVPLKYFGKDLVLFRTESGEIGLLDAFCPHLGAHLGHGGKVKGENLECPFHAWQFGANGKCNAVPYAKHMPRKADIGTWRTCPPEAISRKVSGRFIRVLMSLRKSSRTRNVIS